jgi:predicted ATPase/class 3 adenylate cyclase
MLCNKCNTENAEGHRFCFNCGAPLTAPSAEKSDPVDGELRQVSVMFCDLVGSTNLSSALDPEELREIIRSFQDACVPVVEHYDGFIAQHLGDGLLIYFGYPRAHEDDGERAVLAGLDIIKAVNALQPRPALQLHVRVGIATGKVVVGDLVSSGANLDKVAVGQTPNLAARLQALAEPDSIVISPHTYKLIGQRFEYEDRGLHELKGIDKPVRVREVLKQRSYRSRFEAAHSGNVLPLVDRFDEMAIMTDRWQQAAKGKGQALLLNGEAGIGKSRLGSALIEKICGHGKVATRELQCSPYHRQSVLYPVIEWLQKEIFDAGSDTGKWQQINTYLDSTTLDKTEAAPILANLLSVPLPADYAPPIMSPERQKLLTMQYLSALLGQARDNDFVLLIIEDLHWADPSTLELIGLWSAQIVDKNMLALLTCRPEFSSPWGAQENFTAVHIDRLPDEYAMEMVRLAAGGSCLPQSVIEQFVKKTDNIPLYLEEMTKDIVDMQGWGDGDSCALVQIDPASIVIPTSLQDSLMARLDRMGETRSVAQIAAILGREFGRDILQAIWTGKPAVLDQGIQTLIEAGLLYVRNENNQQQYQFKHALIRDAAYESLLKRTREKQHLHIAQVMEREFPDIVSKQPDVLAQHFTAGNSLNDALKYWLAAAQLALKNYAMQEAIAHINHGLELLQKLPDTPERALTELDFRITLGPALMMTQGYASEEVRVSCDRAQELCSLVGNVPQIPVTLFLLWTYHCVAGNHVTAYEVASQLVQVAEHTQNDDLLVEGYLTLGATSYFLGNFREAIANLEKSHAYYDAERHAGHAFQFGQDPFSAASNFLTMSYLVLDEADRARQTIDQGVAHARRLKHPFTLSFSLSYAIFLRILTRDYAAAADLIRENIQLCSDQGIILFLAMSKILSGWYVCETEGDDKGLPEIQAGLELFRMTGSRALLSLWEARRALASANTGDSSKAAEIIEQAYGLIQQTGEHWAEAEIHRYHGMILEQQGARPADVEACYQQAITLAQQQGARLWEKHATQSLAQFLESQGDTARAQQLLQAATNPVVS